MAITPPPPPLLWALHPCPPRVVVGQRSKSPMSGRRRRRLNDLSHTSISHKRAEGGGRRKRRRRRKRTHATLFYPLAARTRCRFKSIRWGWGTFWGRRRSFFPRRTKWGYPLFFCVGEKMGNGGRSHSCDTTTTALCLLPVQRLKDKITDNFFHAKT